MHDTLKLKVMADQIRAGEWMEENLMPNPVQMDLFDKGELPVSDVSYRSPTFGQSKPRFPEPEWFMGRWEPEWFMGRWEKVAQKLPPSCEPVLLASRYSGRWHIIRAQYAAKFTLVGHPDVDTDWCDYDEEQDEYFCPEGWYETNAFEESNWRVSGTPVYWAHLPALPQDAVEQTQGDVVPSASGFKAGRY